MSGTNGSRDDEPSKRTGAGKGAGKPGGAQPGDPCAIRETAPLNSPKAAVLAKHKVGDVFVIQLDKVGTRSVLNVVDANGEVVGSLTHRGYQTLIDCISKGNRYKATLTRKSGGANEVLIERT